MNYRTKDRWLYKGKVTKQGPTSAKDLIIELPEERESSFNRLDLTNLTYCLIYGH